MRYSVVLSTQPAQFQAATFKGGLENNLAAIAAMGYDGVELAIRDPALVNLEQLQRLTKKFTLEVPAIGTGQAWGEEKLSFTDPDVSVREKAAARILSHIPAAASFNAIIIIGLIRGAVKPGVSQEQAEAWLCEALQTCAHNAAAAGVRLALEPINRYETSLVNTAAQGLELISRVGAANLGLLLDTFHMNIEEPVLEDSIRACGPRIFHFHVADSNRLYPGGGHLDFRSILWALQATGYQNWVSGEFLPRPDAETAAQKSLETLRKLMA